MIFFLFCFFVQLIDMGFSREHAMEALLNTTTMEQATEYLLTHPPPLLSAAIRVRHHHQKKKKKKDFPSHTQASIDTYT